MAQDRSHTAPFIPIGRRDTPFLVGREREQVILREELGAARSGRGRMVLLGGEAGIGKTTLARDLVREATSRGSYVLTGNCYDMTNTPPYGPWLDLFAGYSPGPQLPDPPAAFASGNLERVTDQAALLADVRRFLTELGASRPVLILLEDLHWADPASLELIRHLGPHLRRQPMLMLLVTYRIDELTRRHPLFHLLPALVREADGLRLDLRRLDFAALRSLVAAHYALSPSDEERLAAYLDRHAEGNPFFTTELLRALEDEGLLRETGDAWTLDELDRVVVPPLLRQVIEGRVARLGEAVRRPLAIASVIGQQVPLSVWRDIAGLDEDALLAVVEQAVEARLLAAERSGDRVRFVHAITRETLYDSVLPPRRRHWHARVADRLMASGTRDPDAVAYHLQQSGDDRAWKWLVRAADRAQRAYAWLTAADRLRAAANILADIPGEEDRRCRLLYRHARLKRFSLPAEALATLDEASLLAGHLNDSILAGDIQFTRGVTLCYANRFRAGLAELWASARALEALPLEMAPYYDTSGQWLADTPPEPASETPDREQKPEVIRSAAALRSRHAAFHWMVACADQPAVATASAERYLAALPTADTSAGIRFSAAYAWHALGIAHAALGRLAEPRAAWRNARAIYDEFGHHALRALTLLAELRDVALTFDAANPGVRRELAAEAEVTIERAGGAFRPGVSAQLAWLGTFVLDGRWDEADRILAIQSAPGNAFLEREVTAVVTELARHRGQPDAAWELIMEHFPDGPATEPGDCIHQEGLLLQRQAAELCLDSADHRAAHDWLCAHDRWLEWSGSLLGRADGQYSWARYSLETSRHDTARAHALEALSLAAMPDQPLVRLRAHRLLGEIELASGDLREAESAITSALTLAERCEAPFERALVMLALAELLAARGDTGAALSNLEEARAVFAALGATRVLSKADALAAQLATTPDDESNPARLTPREMDVLRLLVKRRTDKEIADALFLGHRTVQTHVANIISKLGVANRREAAAKAEALDLL